MADKDQVYIISGEPSPGSAVQTPKVFTFNTVTPAIGPIEMNNPMVAGNISYTDDANL